MRFMIIRKADAKTEAKVMPSRELLAAMGQYMEEMANAGILLGGDGLHPSDRGKRVKFSGGKPTVIDGPFRETKELIAGFALIEVKSMDEAIQWVKRWPALDGDGSVELEIRPLLEDSDFGEEFTPEMRQREEKLRAELEQKKK